MHVHTTQSTGKVDKKPMLHMYRAYDNDWTSDILRVNSSHDRPNVILGGQIVRRKRAAATDKTCPPNQVIRIQKLLGHTYFRETFAEVIVFAGASAPEF